MVRIGDFARMARVTIKALRYYDAIGLLHPARIDRATGYRYYSPSQLPLLNRILVYKNLGFSLDQTRALIAEGAPAGKMRELLEHRRQELSRQLAIEHAQLGEVESRINQIEREGRRPIYEVLVKRTDPRPAIHLRRTLANYDALDPLLHELAAPLGKSDIEARGAIWHQCLFSGSEIDCEAFVILKNAGGASSFIPAGTVASVIYSDTDHDPFPQIYRAVFDTLDAESYEVRWPMREIYHTPDVTEIQFPLHRRTAS
jgi:DNA-binding transcriptional MerR regulator